MSPYLWHNDLHSDNIFVDPDNPDKITGIIDRQSCHISPLFNHNPDPAFLNWDNGLEPETLELAPKPKLSELSPEERATAMREYTTQNIFIAWRKLMHAKNPELYRVIEFRKTPAYGLIFLAHRIFEYGEAHFQSLVVDLIYLLSPAMSRSPSTFRMRISSASSWIAMVRLQDPNLLRRSRRHWVIYGRTRDSSSMSDMTSARLHLTKSRARY